METLESMDKKVDIHATEDNRVDLKATVDNSREVDLPTNSQPAEREQGADDLLSKSVKVDHSMSGCGEDKVMAVPPPGDGNLECDSSFYGNGKIDGYHCRCEYELFHRSF